DPLALLDDAAFAQGARIGAIQMNDGSRFWTVSKQRHSLSGLPVREFELQLALEYHPHGLVISANHLNGPVLQSGDSPAAVAGCPGEWRQFIVVDAREQSTAIGNKPNAGLGLRADDYQAVARLRLVGRFLADGAVDLT